ncbi:MAG: ABC transporter substrate-binding protein [Chloroflexaceae bacterium]|nr:ABC transporter substrate-binding protein [Chloroflexaceae bacterium]
MERRDFLRGVGASVLSGTAMYLGACSAPSGGEEGMGPNPAPMQASSLPVIEWRMATSWPNALDVLQGAAVAIGERLSAMTEGRFTISVFEAGEIVPALEVLDAVQNRTVECGHTAAYYFIGKNEAFGIATSLPFGLTAQQQNAWLYYGGGLEAVQKLYRDFGVVSFPAGNTGVQMGGWFKREINTLGDLKALRFRIPGLGGRVMQRLGVDTQTLAGGDTYLALDRGAIDAAEWVGPYDDEKLGLNKAARFYYYPGWWEPGSTLDVIINQQAWDELPRLYQEIFKAAAYEANIAMLSEYESRNQEALDRLVVGGTVLRPYSEEIMVAAQQAAFDLYEETASADPAFREVFEPWKEFRRKIHRWNGTNESTLMRFVTEHPAA